MLDPDALTDPVFVLVAEPVCDALAVAVTLLELVIVALRDPVREEVAVLEKDRDIDVVADPDGIYAT